MFSFDKYIESIKESFLKPLPGASAQFKMAPGNIHEFKSKGKTEKAAVLLLVYPVDKVPYIVFMKRQEYDGHHSGQISFPGGKYEKSDKTLSNTAIRETIEELGDNLDHIEIIGKLSPLLIPVSMYDIQPFVGFINYKPTWDPDPEEVSYLIETPVDALYRPHTKSTETWNINRTFRQVPFYRIKQEKIWGATAMVLSEYETITNQFC